MADTVGRDLDLLCLAFNLLVSCFGSPYPYHCLIHHFLESLLTVAPLFEDQEPEVV